jgi:hypothetical protein
MPLRTRRSPPHALRRSGLFGSNGLNPFIFGEFTRSDSNLQLGSLNRDPAARLHSERSSPRDASPEAVSAAGEGLLLGAFGNTYARSELFSG